MKLTKNSNQNSQNIVKTNQNVISYEDIKGFNYLYPNLHRITPQMRWFKGSRSRGITDDIAA